MLPAPFFSIIVPTKDRAHLLKECIDSIFKQSFTDFELIIIDNRSSDGTATMLEQIEDQRIFHKFLETPDRSAARNLGIQLSNGKYFCFVDDDDLLKEDYLLNFYNYLSQNDFPDIILRTGYSKLTEKGLFQKPLYNKKRHKNPVRFAAYNMCGIWTLCIPRAFLDRDQFPVGFPHWQDTHLILRLFARHPFVQLPTHNYIYRVHRGRGSEKVISEQQLTTRIENNVAAIKDLFQNDGDLVAPFLAADTAAFLCAEKFLQYAIIAQNYGFTKFSQTALTKSKDYSLDLRLWKEYIIYYYHKWFKN